MARPTLLTYNLSPQTAAALKRVCEALHIRTRAVLPVEYALPVGALAGIPVSKGPEAPAAQGFSEPMLVICFMLSDQLDTLLAAMRQAGVRVPLKAVLTPTNVAWSSVQLHDALASEHEQMNRR